MKKGFTLVELSIALVIVGLLIGGVLVGQSLIDSAKIQKFVRQSQMIDIAIDNFYSKFKGLPGDSSLMGCVTYSSNVCDNGQVEDADVTGSSLTGEMGKFWYDLSVGSSLKSENGQNYLDCSGGTCDIEDPSQELPSSVLGNAKTAWWVFGWKALNSSEIDNWFLVTELVDFGAPSYGSVATITGVDALAVDNKMDDADANTGNVRGEWDNFTSTCGRDTTPYDQSELCGMSFRFGANAGTLR